MTVTLDVPEPTETTQRDVATASPWMCILHNCDCHGFREVVAQLIKALECSETHAVGIANVAQESGKAIAKVGSKPECLRVSKILTAIGLQAPIICS